MKFNQGLEKAKFLKRYKRFLCDVRLDSGEQTTIHCPNTGSMKNCCFENAPVWVSRSANEKRKYPCTWEMLETPKGHKIGINTGLANKLVIEAIESNKIKELSKFKYLRSEVKYGEENSRIDIRLESEQGVYTYIEVKSVTLLEDDGWGYFPDSISERGQKHLRELMSVIDQGHQAVLFFCIQHSGIHKMKAAQHIDVKYAELLKKAVEKGVLVLAYTCELNPDGIEISKQAKFVH